MALPNAAVPTAAADWNTIASDLQRAVNNLAWFVLESMSVPEQPPVATFGGSVPLYQVQSFLPPLPPPPALQQQQPQQESTTATKTKKRNSKSTPVGDSDVKKRNLGEAVDRLIAETLV